MQLKLGLLQEGYISIFPQRKLCFEALFELTLKEYYRRNVELTDNAIQQIANQKFDLFHAASDSGNRAVPDYIYHHFDAFQLMFNRSAGTKYETIRHDLVMLEVSRAKRLIVVLRKQEISVREFNDEQLHM